MNAELNICSGNRKAVLVSNYATRIRGRHKPYHAVFDAILTSRQIRLEITVFVWKSNVK